MGATADFLEGVQEFHCVFRCKVPVSMLKLYGSGDGGPVAWSCAELGDALRIMPKRGSVLVITLNYLDVDRMTGMGMGVP
jgi:hypothetical protein